MKDKFISIVEELVQTTDKIKINNLRMSAYVNSTFLVPKYSAELSQIICVIKAFCNEPNSINKEHLIVEIEKIKELT